MGGSSSSRHHHHTVVDHEAERRAAEAQAAAQRAAAAALQAQQQQAMREEQARIAVANAAKAQREQARKADVARLECERAFKKAKMERERAQAAVQQLAEQKRMEAVRVQQELARERVRVLHEKRSEWERMNRDYPIPQYLQSFVSPSWVGSRILNIGVVGSAGVGKSTLIRGLLEHFNPEIPVCQKPQISFEGDGTRQATLYALQTSSGKVNVWDVPGQGTASTPAKSYLRDMGLKYFDGLLLVMDGRLASDDVTLIQSIIAAGKWYRFLRTKIDLAVEAGQYDRQLSQEEVLHEVHSTLSKQLSGTPSDHVHLVTLRKQYWVGAHGGVKFGAIDGLCKELSAFVLGGSAS